MTTNSAYRLYSAVEELNSEEIATGDELLYDALSTIYDLDKKDRPSLHTCLADLNRLVKTVEKDLKKTEAKMNRSLSPEYMRTIFIYGNNIGDLHGALPMKSVRGILKRGTTLTALEACANVLDLGQQDEPELEDDELERLHDQARALEEYILSCEIDGTIKESLLPIIEELLQAIKLIRLRGAQAVIEIYEHSIGKTFTLKSRIENGQAPPSDEDKGALDKWIGLLERLHRTIEVVDKTKTMATPALETVLRFLPSP